ncbi:L,D-transpeptidase family protein [Ancylobacter vacuolatus]|uniref:Murein L,D-transpeptidase YcbB/YkuD n=1 Tax=Ancylobacter vacuolatus TaxID=223389 RepID=A0ABU0DJ85_9HYPH|nr:L,D-transpeptidase family protein [Ancylobacter vacuolatus]MDQ0348444.1 murein L,D-transpeptidase YcbB/YkuD [Ancylobacter vacuolatus]
MSGRGVTGKGEGRGAVRPRAGAARLLTVAGLAFAAAGSSGLSVMAQENGMATMGSAIAIDRAGEGTGDSLPAFNSDAAGILRSGEAAAALPAIAADDQPFDATDPRRPSPARSAALALQSPAAPLGAEVAAEPGAVVPSAAPTVGDGAPGLGEGTNGTATESGAAPGPALAAPAVSAGETAFSKRLAAIVASELARFAARSADREALTAYYTARNFQPAFTGEGGLAPIGQVALDTFAVAGAEGLDPADYAVPPLAANADAAQLAETEMRLAATTLLYARHVQSGRFDPKTLSKDVDPSPTVPDSAAVLARVADARDPQDARAALASFAPQYDQYRLLKEQLAQLQAQGQVVSHAPIPPGPSLRPGESDPRVPLLRARLGVGVDAGAQEGDEFYDDRLVEAVRAFQRLAGQSVDGIVGRGTLAALNDAGADPIPDIIANMERWRWLPHEVAPAYVMVNIPEFMVRIVVDGSPVHETRVVVGKPETQTPILSESMQYAVFNPSWHVPPSIIRNEMLPKLRADPYALVRQGIDVVRNGRVIDPGTVDWRRAGTQGYSFRQEPGERNALGRMKFMFPNKHSVYLHDTPSRALFARDRRAFSHGCVRVHEPMEFAEALFALGRPGEGWSQQRLSRLLGGDEKSLPLKNKFPVHLVYFTSFVDGNGRLVTREDLYGTNAATKSALGIGGARQFADRRADTVRR